VIERILAVAWKELLQVRRDRLTLAMMVALPVMQLLLFGFAINTDVRNIPLTVLDADHSPASREVVERLLATGYYDMAGYVETELELGRAIRSGEAKVALEIPPRYERQVMRGEKAQLGLIVDGADPQTVGSATNAATGAVGRLSAEAAARRARALGSPSLSSRAAIELEPQIWYNPDLRTAVFIVPGLAGVILTLTLVMFTSMAIARERERGTLEQLIVSPIRGIELVLGKIAPYVGVGFVQLGLILWIGQLVFEVTPQGSTALLFLLSSLFIAASLAIGLAFSTLARTQQQAMQMSFFFLLPNILLSGFMFPWEAMPAPIRMASQGLPLTHFLRIVRGIVLRGANYSELAREVEWLAAILLVLIVLTSLRFRKKLA
jgi:ABC-2 type transport system permease protein